MVTEGQFPTSGSAGSATFNLYWQQCFRRVEGDFIVCGISNCEGTGRDEELDRYYRFSPAMKRLVGRTIVSVQKYADETALQIILDDGTKVKCYDGEQYRTSYGLEIDGVDVSENDE